MNNEFDMKNELEWTLSRGVAFSEARFYVLAFSSREFGTRVFRWTGQWDNYYVPCRTAGIAAVRTPSPEILSLCLDGTVHSAGPNGFSSDSVDLDEPPEQRGILRCLSVVKDEVYAAGLGRQVFKRSVNGKWSRIDRQIAEPKGSENVGGFESIDGFDSSEIYAVGMNGEICRFDGAKWDVIPGLTNLILSKVLCAPDGTVYIAGQLGTLIKGRTYKWEILEQDGLDDTIWDLAWHGEKLWLSTINSLYVLQDDEIVPVEVDQEPDISFRYLASRDDALWSIGAKSLLLRKADSWTVVPLP
jgi:hypothetical protein